MLCLVFLLARPAYALEFHAPEVPESGSEFMPDETQSFAEGLWSIIKEGIVHIKPSFAQSAGICFSVSMCVILCSIVKAFPGAQCKAVELVGTILLGFLLLQPSNAMIHLGTDTIKEISNYGKLLFPVLTAALAASGGVTQSAALYAGAVAVNTAFTSMISSILVPTVYVYLCLAVVSGAINNQYLEKIKSFIKWLTTWGLKLVLYAFGAFMSLSGVITGAVDSNALKATKLAISGLVPVVGSILSDASETVLISASLVRNSAGVYGLFAVLSIWIGPFIRIGTQYLLLKLTWSFCEVFSTKETCKLIGDFSSAMGLILGMTGTVCVLLLISIVCFMKGVGG